MSLSFLRKSVAFTLFGMSLLSPAGASVGPLKAKVWLKSHEGELKSWTVGELRAMKQVSSRERHPHSGEVRSWNGVLLSSLIMAAIEKLPAEEKAQLDYVLLTNAQGERVLIPRAMAQKYPVLLAIEQERIISVPPWTSKSRILQEGIPVEPIFLENVAGFTLGNYRQSYGEFFLKRRTDPAAMRGEKLFVQNCISCHAVGRGPSVATILGPEGEQKSRALASATHSKVKAFPDLSAKEKRALVRYLDARGLEAPATVAPPATAR